MMRRMIFWGVPAVFLLAGCVTVFVTVEPPTPSPTSIILSTLPPPTDPVVASPSPAPFTPACRADPLVEACSAPTAGMLSKSCIKKIPYTLVGISPGATFEILDAGMTCKDEKVRGNAHQYSCTGRQLYSYHVRVCNPDCAAALAADSGQCPAGNGFSESAGCCWPLPAAEAGCVTYKVDIGGCQ